ncbi:S1C family serine protease [Streptomyces sp. HB132]|uniref:S1C family serine protease n=1 Tax=Streptomyces sp. HB132 TaxID=767388 RepID=UPI0019606A96|nr:trypsin-like peptidase domain-containing protein [Streptomyces sp. HB132]MBM7437436.1 putative serine protease PepD [Streptomyces sp. HB132]
MDDGKPSGPKTKWWSRPPTERNRPAGPDDTAAVTDIGAVARTDPDGTTGPMAAEPRTHVTPDGDYTPAPPAPGPHTPDATEPRTPAPDATEPGTPPPPAAEQGALAPGATEPGTPGPSPAGPLVHRTQPLHAPDEYSTPPYGGPGPWAPAPPVQRPVATPAHGTPVPPPYAGADGHGAAAPLPAPAPPAAPGGQGHAETWPPLPAPHTVPQQHAAPQDSRTFSASQTSQQAPQAAQASRQAPQQPSQWLRYDPWGAAQPLTHPGPGPDPRPRKGRRGTVLVGAALLALVAGGIGGGIGAYVERNGGLTTVELPQSGRDDGDRAPDSVAGIASSALPSVVTLHVNGSAESGTGTGFVLDDKGHILTNNHVVAPAGSTGDITVTFSGGESASAEIVGKDSGYDLAVVKVTGVSGLKPLPLGNSDNVRVGDPVVAIGAPFDLSNTVTSGIISAKQRPITAGGEKGDGTDVSYVDALQTDAPINPGNSGGPLVDADARVIGINSAIRAADSGSGLDGGQSGSIGLGFAIPINQGKRVAEELINTGKATHPVIGVTLDMEFTGDGAKVGGKAADGGEAVTEGGPADKAGIRAGDVITEVEGRRVHSGEELIVKIRAHRPGDRLGLVLTRGGKDLSVTLTLGSASGT